MYRRICSISLALVITLLTLAACGPKEEPAVPTSPPVAAESTPTEETAEAEDVFRIALMWDTWTLDPAHGYGSWAADLMMRMSYDTLVSMRGYPYQPEMRLAESYEVNDDYTEWTFKLREDAVFHDGSPVTAEDVEYTWKRNFAVGSELMGFWADVADADSVSVLDEHTVRFELRSPFADFLSTLPWFYIVNADVVSEHVDADDYGQAWLAENEAGSGPFVLESYEPNNQHVFAAVPDYWHGWPNPDHMDKIIIKIMPASSTQKLSLQKGDIDWAGDLDYEDFLSLEDEPGIVTNVRGENVYLLHMNNQQGPTSDPNVRKAIAHAFNYDALLEGVIGEKPQGLVGPNVPGFLPQDMPQYDLEKAREYLAQSPWPDGGFEITFRYLADYTPDELCGLLLKEGLEQLGITVELVPTEWTLYFELCQSPETATMLSIEFPEPYSISQVLDERYNSTNWGSVTGCSFYKNEEVDRLLQALKAEPDTEAIATIQKLVLEDMPQLVTFIYGYKEAYSDRLQGLGESHPYPYPPHPEDLYFSD